jgi:tetratricopeptide (TPR) repeat protein
MYRIQGENKMRGKWSVVVVILVAIGGVSCAQDPAAAKRQFVAQGDRYLAEKKFPDAILEYRNALRQDAKFGEARLKLADAYLAMGDLRNALGESVRAADVLPDNVDAQLRAGALLLVDHKFPEAKARALAALAKDPKNASALVLLGDSLAGLKDLDGAIQQVQQAIDQNPQLTLSYANLGALYVAKGDREAAEATFKRAVEVAPKSVDAHLSLANFRWATDARDEAEREIKIALQLEPRSATANRALAVLYLTENKPNEAEPYLEDVCGRDQHGRIATRVGRLLRRQPQDRRKQGHPDEARLTEGRVRPRYLAACGIRFQHGQPCAGVP